MTIINKTTTMLGANAKVISFTVYPLSTGGYNVTVEGTVDDGAGNFMGISTRAAFGNGVAVLNNMAATALQRLRQDNGLET